MKNIYELITRSYEHFYGFALFLCQHVMAFISVESRQMISAGIESYASDAMKNLLAQARTSLLGLSFQ